MYIELDVVTSEDYFSQTEREVDWDEDDDSKLPSKQADLISKILATESAIYLLRRARGGCGSLADSMVNIRRSFIDEYEKIYEPYVKYNDFY